MSRCIIPRESREFVPSVNHHIGINLGRTTERRHNRFFKKFGGGIGSRTHGAYTPFRVFKAPSCHQRYSSVKWGDGSVFSDFSRVLAGYSRSHELPSPSLRGRTDSRRDSPSISQNLRSLLGHPPRQHADLLSSSKLLWSGRDASIVCYAMRLSSSQRRL